jgi:chaperonin cofactor prefoldin
MSCKLLIDRLDNDIKIISAKMDADAKAQTARIDQLNARMDQNQIRIDQTQDRIDQTNTRMDQFQQMFYDMLKVQNPNANIRSSRKN